MFLENLGFYILFLFKLMLVGLLSLIVHYFYKGNEDAETLKMHSVLSLIVVAFVAIAHNYSQDNTSILPFVIGSIFAILIIILLNQNYSKRLLTKLFLMFCMSIFIGLGYYVSSITFIIILFFIESLFQGIFDFFILDKEDEESISEDSNDYIDFIDEDIDIIDEE